MPQAKATHIVGGELTYEYLGNNNYKIYLTVYRDCFGGQADYDNPALLGVFNSSNVELQTVEMFLGVVNQVPSTINNPCITPPNNVCVEVTTYTTTLNLPPIPGGYQLAYQRCCRNGIIQNIITPGDVGATYYAQIPDPTVHGDNSSPVFNNTPPLYLCADLQFTFDHSATDPDGDVLVYELCEPFQGLSPVDPAAPPIEPPPYNSVIWQNPYSVNDMLGGVPLTINPQTGVITATPSTIGTFVVGICVSEYRNGVLINQTKRDFQFTVADCQPQVVSSFFTPSVQCNNTVTFTNNSFGANKYHWDFGVSGTLADTSNSYSPTFSYPGPGEYTVTLAVVDSANGCGDTSTYVFNLYNVDIEAEGDTFMCAGEGAPLLASGGVQYSWSPIAGLDNPNIGNPIASPSNTTTYVVVGTDSAGCTGLDTVYVLIAPNVIDAGVDESICIGESIGLGATGTPGQVIWSPANTLDTPTSANPLATPTVTTTYHVSLLTNAGCTNSDSVTVTVNPLPIIDAGPDTAICNGESTVLMASGGILYSWSPTTGLSDSMIANPTTTPLATTTYAVTGISQFGCQNTDNVTVIVKPRPNAYAGEDEIICLGDSVQLHATGGVSYFWAPNTNLSNPAISNPWTNSLSTIDYLVTVTGANGCDSTDVVTVNVVSPPIAGLSVQPDACIYDDVVVSFTGQASPFASYGWNFNGGNVVSGTGEGPYTINWNSTGTKIISVGVDENVCGIDQASDTIEIKPLPPSEAGMDVSFCSGESVTIGTGDLPNLSYQWSPTNGIDSANSSNPNLSLTSPTGQTQVLQYMVTTTSQYGCISRDSLEVTVFPIPVAEFETPEGQCIDGNSFGYIAGGVFGNGAQFDWDFGTSATPPTSTFEMPNNIVFSDSGSHDISLTIAENGCVSEPFIAPTRVYPVPIALLQGIPVEGCQPMEVEFEDLSDDHGYTLAHKWTFGDDGTSILENPIHTYINPGLYSVGLEVITGEGCKDDTLYKDYIWVHPKPYSDFYARPEVKSILDPDIEFYDNSVGANSAAYYLEGEEISNNWNFEYTFSDTGYHVISQIVTTKYGCLDTSDVSIYIQPIFTLYVPNAFTPNTDKKNPIFYCYGEGIREFELNIFTRWGQNIYHSVDLYEGWDGTYKGKPATDDVYVWRVTVVTYSGESKQFTGHVTLIR